MPRALADYLDITAGAARRQWAEVSARAPGAGQRFLPVEVLLCYGLFFVMSPHRYGGGNIHLAPAELHMLAGLFRRSPGSISQKMLNLDGSRPHAARHEWALFAALADDPALYGMLYKRVMEAAVAEGIDPASLPDLLGLGGGGDDLLGQEELVATHLHRAIDGRVPATLALGASPIQTWRIIEHRIRLGQHRFAREVLRNYDFTCGFCGFDAKPLPGRRLLVASHIKPWAASSDRERLDAANGVAACPTHDAAFDTGLVTVNGGLRIHRSPELVGALGRVGMAQDFEAPVLRDVLLVPPGGRPPGRQYLEYHRATVFAG